ncbi:uncharacterized protein LOC113334004 [Papaver somniferum]|uniref:uncharacterized protein LOC113334004 n=1 Tax=Papaver somniferum TaxID=3469 RepID=UPI000E6F599E|nr:uncharacterized protein LOC113334004 [Papaver somniferum]
MFLKARFVDCQFDESIFPSLGGNKPKLEERREISWNTPSLAHFDPRTKKCELEVQRIIHLQNIANQMPDAFTDTGKVTKSHIPAANTPARVSIPDRHHDNQSTIRLKRGRPLGAKDLVPRKKRSVVGIPEKAILSETLIDQSSNDTQVAPEEAHVPQNNEISINYMLVQDKTGIGIQLFLIVNLLLQLL